VPEGKKARVRVRTVNTTYVGDLFIPPMRNRVSDVFNDDERMFINLTNVIINDREQVEFVSVNKHLVESLTQIS
jgi:DNA phosphorothioation-dependent restriction protein DptG